MINRTSVNFNKVASTGIWLKKQINKSTTNNSLNKNTYYVSRNILFKEEIKDLTLIGQFDNKFLILIRPKDNALIIFDQHAVHERILYEYYTLLLYKELYGQQELQKSNNARLNLFEDIYGKYVLDKEIKVKINDYNINMKHFAAHCSIRAKQSLFFFEFIYDGDNSITLLAVPIIFDKIHKLEKLIGVLSSLLNNIDMYLKEYKEKSNEMTSNKIIMLFDSWIRSKACRNAIKFNMEIDEEYMQLLIKNLGECNNPFLCAHGRHNFFFLKQKKTSL